MSSPPLKIFTYTYKLNERQNRILAKLLRIAPARIQILRFNNKNLTSVLSCTFFLLNYTAKAKALTNIARVNVHPKIYFRIFEAVIGKPSRTISGSV